MDDDDLDAQRAALADLDARILDLVAERQARSLRIGRVKRSLGRGTRDFTREKVVMDAARAGARARGLDPSLAERMVRLLIEASLSVQEQDRVARTGSGVGRHALVVGGAGRMGRWFTGLLTTQGWDVGVVDPHPGPDDLPHHPSLGDADIRGADLIVVATPLDRTADALHAIGTLAPRGVVVDIASVKAPVIPALHALRDAGVRTTSLHPMFGPDTSLLSGRHVLVCDAGDADATAVARSLFSSTLADLVDVALPDHDRLVAWVLNASHAVNLAFGAALARAPVDADTLARLGSTTFDAQCRVTARVVAEDPDLYRTIQTSNPHGADALRVLADALDALRDAIDHGDADAFRALMRAGRDYLATQASWGSGAPHPSQG